MTLKNFKYHFLNIQHEYILGVRWAICLLNIFYFWQICEGSIDLCDPIIIDIINEKKVQLE